MTRNFGVVLLLSLLLVSCGQQLTPREAVIAQLAEVACLKKERGIPLSGTLPDADALAIAKKYGVNSLAEAEKRGAEVQAQEKNAMQLTSETMQAGAKLCGLSLADAFPNTTQEAQEQEASQPTVSGTGSEMQPAQVGEPVRIGSFEVVAGNHEYISVLREDSPALAKVAKGKFLALELGITNVSTEPKDFTLDALQLIDSKGRKFTYDFSATYTYASDKKIDTSVSGLQPDLRSNNAVVFDIPADSEGLKLKMVSSVTGDKYIEIK